MEFGDLGGSVLRANNANIERLRTQGVDPEFFGNFSGNLVSLTRLFIPNNSSPSIKIGEIEQEGRTGILPPPARRIAAQAILSGQAIPPMRIFEKESVHIKEEKQAIDSVSLRAILEVSPLDSASFSRQASVVNAILSIDKIVALKEMSRKSSGAGESPLDLRMKNLDAVIYIIRKGVLGYCDYTTVPIASERDAQKALNLYREALDYVLRFHPEDIPKGINLTREVINSQIIDSIEYSREQGKICLVVADVGISGLKMPYLRCGWNSLNDMRIEQGRQ